MHKPKAEWRIAKDTNGAARIAAGEFARIVTNAVRERDVAFVALAGGSTPKATYELLASAEFAGQVPWQNIYFFFGDERCVPVDSSDRNDRMARESMLQKMGIAQPRVFSMPAERADHDAAAREYEQSIRSIINNTKNNIPRFDLILLGMGADGHTASLFPGSAELLETKRLVTTAFGGPQPVWRLTFTLPVLNAARNVMITATGESKSTVLKRVLDLNDPNPLPAARVAPEDGLLIWVLDAALANAAGIAQRNHSG
ncbi:MAG: 6-phosphogluconolactonase [Planctomycetota bacterium]